MYTWNHLSFWHCLTWSDETPIPCYLPVTDNEPWVVLGCRIHQVFQHEYASPSACAGLWRTEIRNDLKCIRTKIRLVRFFPWTSVFFAGLQGHVMRVFFCQWDLNKRTARRPGRWRCFQKDKWESIRGTPTPTLLEEVSVDVILMSFWCGSP